MNTDIFGKEERKQMLTRIERMELMNNDTAKTLAAINESLRLMNEKIEGRDCSKVTAAEPMPEPVPVEHNISEETKRYVEGPWISVRAVEQSLDVLKEIRSGIAETNSILASMMRAIHNIDAKLTDAVLAPKLPTYPTQPPWHVDDRTTDPLPQPPYRVTCDNLDDTNPYIPKNEYGDDTNDVDVSKLEPKPFNDKQED